MTYLCLTATYRTVIRWITLNFDKFHDKIHWNHCCNSTLDPNSFPISCHQTSNTKNHKLNKKNFSQSPNNCWRLPLWQKSISIRCNTKKTFPRLSITEIFGAIYLCSRGNSWSYMWQFFVFLWIGRFSKQYNSIIVEVLSRVAFPMFLPQKNDEIVYK